MTEWLSIAAKVKRNPEKKYLIFCLFASHGMIKNNEQVVICNEFKPYLEKWTSENQNEKVADVRN